MKVKKTGVSTNTIINPRLERRLKRKEDRLKKMNTCKKCKHFNKNSMMCNIYNFRISTIELGLKCKKFKS